MLKQLCNMLFLQGSDNTAREYSFIVKTIKGSDDYILNGILTVIENYGYSTVTVCIEGLEMVKDCREARRYM